MPPGGHVNGEKHLIGHGVMSALAAEGAAEVVVQSNPAAIMFHSGRSVQGLCRGTLAAEPGHISF